MFDDLDDDYDDDFEDSQASKANDNFNANELLNFSDYQNKRRGAVDSQKQTSGALNIKDVLTHNATKLNNNQYDGEIEVNDDWGEDDWGDEEEDIGNVEYKKANLNKLSDAQLAAHKKLMDKDFGKN